MKVLSIILTFFIGAFSNILPIEEAKWDNLIYFPDADGVMHIIDLEEQNLPEYPYDPATDMNFYMFNRRLQDTHGEFYMYDKESLMATKFDPKKPVKITIHGWRGNGLHNYNRVIAEAFLDAMDVNVIAIDWEVGAAANYVIAALKNIPPTGKRIGQLIDWLNSLGVPFTNIHVIGHSLGAHVAGVTGRSTTNGTVEYVTGLDPAFPLFDKRSHRIRRTDGKYVEIIHTNGNRMGLMVPVGHTDFYPNGGVRMPGCGMVDYSCSHHRAYFYFADSIDHERFVSKKCNSLMQIKKNKCPDDEKLHMGGASVKTKYRGLYYLETNAEKPFYKE